MTRDLGFHAPAEERVAIWEANARKWPAAGPPWRPSPGDIAVYRRLLGAGATGRVVLFGVTPELRDLLARAGIRPVVVDTSAAMHAATSRLLRDADAAHETWIQTDWCDSGLAPGSVDLLLGDMLWWVDSVAKQRSVRDAIHALLKPGGLFVGRVRCTDVARAAADPAAAVQAYLARLDSEPEKAGVIQGAMLSWLYDHTEDREQRMLNPDRTRELLLTLAERPDFVRHEAFLTGAASSLIGAGWTSQSRPELLDLIGERFEVVDEAYAGDYESGLYPIFALRPI
jgi:hypothetical protein